MKHINSKISSGKMHLVMLTGSFDKSQPQEGFFVDWVESLAQQVDMLSLIIPNAQKTKSDVSNLRIYTIAEGNKLQKMMSLWKIISKINREKKVDGIFAHIFPFLAIPSGLWGKVKGVPSVFWYAGGIKLSFISLTHLAMRANDVVITCSNQEKQRYSKAFILGPKKVVDLGHAVKVKGLEAKLKPLRDEKEWHLGFIGRATPNKNIETLIKSASMVKSQRNIVTHLLLARVDENKQYVDKLRDLIKKVENRKRRFVIHSYVPHDQIASYLEQMHLYIHPSLMKSIDKAALEAVVAKVPVLLSREGLGEVVGRDGEEFLFNPHDTIELTRKIELALQNYRSFSIKQKSLQERTISYYSLPEFMKRLVTLFQKQITVQ